MKDFLVKYRVYVIIFGIALLVRAILFFINFSHSNYNLVDTIHGDDGYYEISQGLLHGHGFTGDIHEPFLPNPLRTPLYIYFISGILFLTKSYWVVIILQILIGSCIPLLGYHIAYTLYPSRRRACIVGVMLALEPYLVLFSSIFYTETLFIFLFLLFICVFLRYLTEGSLRMLVWSSVIFGLATLTKTTVEYLPIALSILILWSFRKKFSPGKLVVHACIFSALFLAILSPWFYRNYVEFGTVGMTAQPAYNLYVYLVPSVLSLEKGTNFNDEVKKLVTTDESSGNVITLRNSHEYTQKAVAVLKRHPLGLIKSMAFTILTFFAHDGMLTVLQHAGYVPAAYIGKPALSLLLSSPIAFVKIAMGYVKTPFALILILRLVWIVITLFFVVGMVRFVRDRKLDPICLFITGIILYFVLTSAVGGLGVNARYRMPIVPIIFTLSIAGFAYTRNAILASHAKK
jgi:4-amino-4-deoxy-L-arabinose transferase-like glycosyltransferase